MNNTDNNLDNNETTEFTETNESETSELNETLTSTNDDVATTTSIEPEETDAERHEARANGHKSLDQWTKEGKDPALYKNAKQFNSYAKDYRNSLKKLESELSRVSRQNQELIQSYKQNAEQAVVRAKIEIEKQLQQAEINGDVRAIKQLAVQKAQMDVQTDNAQKDLIISERLSIDQEFFNRNADWFNDNNPQLKEEAMRIKNRLWAENPNANYATVARDIEAEMRWKHRLNMPNQPTNTPVAPHFPSAKSNVNKTIQNGSSRLNRDQEIEFNAVRADLKQSGIEYTEADYFKAINKPQ